MPSAPLLVHPGFCHKTPFHPEHLSHLNCPYGTTTDLSLWIWMTFFISLVSHQGICFHTHYPWHLILQCAARVLAIRCSSMEISLHHHGFPAHGDNCCWGATFLLTCGITAQRYWIFQWQKRTQSRIGGTSFGNEVGLVHDTHDSRGTPCELMLIFVQLHLFLPPPMIDLLMRDSFRLT